MKGSAMKITRGPSSNIPEEHQAGVRASLRWEVVAAVLESAGFVNSVQEEITGFELTEDELHFLIEKKYK